jgi:hypothetical protein
MLTVNVWAPISATPSTAAPVWKLVLAPPTDTVMSECAGQNSVGFHCRTRSLSHVKVPLGVAGDAMSTLCSAAARSVMAPANVTVTGCATPTVVPIGEMLTTSVGTVLRAELVATDPDRVIAATPAAMVTNRAALRTVGSRWRRVVSTLSS